MKKIEIGDRVKVERTGRVGVVVGIGERIKEPVSNINDNAATILFPK